MKKFFGMINDYVLECDWKDLTLIKICVCSFGVMLGLRLPREKRKPATVISGIMFLISGMLLAVRLLGECPFCKEESEQKEEDHHEDEDGFIMRIVEEE